MSTDIGQCGCDSSALCWLRNMWL